MKKNKKRLTKLDKITIKELYKEFEFSYERLGEMYGISRQRVHQIIKGK